MLSLAHLALATMQWFFPHSFLHTLSLPPAPIPSDTLPDSISQEHSHDDVMDMGDYSQHRSNAEMDSDSQEEMDLDNMAQFPCSDLLVFCAQSHHTYAELFWALSSHCLGCEAIVCFCVSLVQSLLICRGWYFFVWSILPFWPPFTEFAFDIVLLILTLFLSLDYDCLVLPLTLCLPVCSTLAYSCIVSLPALWHSVCPIGLPIIWLLDSAFAFATWSDYWDCLRTLPTHLGISPVLWNWRNMTGVQPTAGDFSSNAICT